MFVIPENIFFILLGYFFGSLTVVYYLVRRQFNSDVRDIGSGVWGPRMLGAYLVQKDLPLLLQQILAKGCWLCFWRNGPE
jgi:hypothetical protein